MSIEAMKQALDALQHAVPKDTKQAREQFDAIQALRAAIQQAEAQQPATPEPVAWNSIQIASWIGSQLMHQPSMFERAAVCKFVRSLGRHPTLLKHSPSTHPSAPSVPGDVTLTIHELRQLADKFSEGWHEGIKIDAMDVMLLSNAASKLEAMQAAMLSSASANEPKGEDT